MHIPIHAPATGLAADNYQHNTSVVAPDADFDQQQRLTQGLLPGNPAAAQIVDRVFESQQGVGFDLSALSKLTKANQEVFETLGAGDICKAPFATIHSAFEYYASVQPDAIAVESQQRTVTYRELDQQATRLALQLRQRGIGVDDCVPLLLERSIEMVVGMLAVLKTGAAYAPQHVGVATDAQLKHVIHATNAQVVLTLKRFAPSVELLSDALTLSIDADEFQQPLPLPKLVSLDHQHWFGSVPTGARCMVLFTSGTTGVPNGVQVSHRNLCNILTIAPGNLGIRPGTRVSQLLSIAFDMAAWEVLGCLANGGTLLIRGKDLEATARRADVVIATPSILSRFNLDNFDRVQTVAVAGEPCPRPLADAWASRCRFYNACGPTETTIVNTMSPHQVDNPVLCIGKPTPNNTVYILDADRTPCEIGAVGEMWAGGDAVTLGYLDNAELTRERYAPDPFLGGGRMMFNTRDLGRWCSNGELEHLGRTDDQVKVRGFRVELDSVSAVLENQADCRRAVTLKFDSNTLVAFMMPATADTQAARTAVEKKLPYYCVPEQIHALDSLPMTSRGKIDKAALLAVATSRRAHSGRIEDATTVTSAQASQTAGVASGIATVPGADSADLRAVAAILPIETYESVTLPEPASKVRSVLAGHKLYHYWRLVGLVTLANLAMLVYGIAAGAWWSVSGIALQPLANMVIANITLAVLIRQQYVINLLFKLATSVPVSAPLSLRRLMGKVYHFGGLHIGGAVLGTLWMLVFTGSAFAQQQWFNAGIVLSSATLMSGVQILLLPAMLVVMALPPIRQPFHNHFEVVHRFGGWVVLVLFWVFLLLFTQDMNAFANLSRDIPVSYIVAVASAPGTWALLLVTLSIALPWMRLKKVPVTIERPSDHAILARFDYGVTPFAGSSTTISRNPLTEWHSFANVPEPGRDGFRLTISRAGDWTGRLIDDQPSHVWVKGIPTAGVGNVDQLFKRVVWVATGSGIGPTLPHLLAQEVPAHLVWSTRNARKTYGDALVDEILEVEPNALIWDTDERGRPDLIKLAYAAVQAFEAEAVIVIANEKLTRMVVHGMESRGIPAYGAIWDS